MDRSVGIVFVLPILLLIALSLASGIVMIVGGLKMLRLESYGWAMTACIVAVLPFSPVGIIGLVMGVWGLVVLNQPGVRAAFPGHASLPASQRPAEKQTWRWLIVVAAVCVAFICLIPPVAIALLKTLPPKLPNADVRDPHLEPRPSDGPAAEAEAARSDSTPFIDSNPESKWAREVAEGYLQSLQSSNADDPLVTTWLSENFKKRFQIPGGIDTWVYYRFETYVIRTQHMSPAHDEAVLKGTLEAVERKQFERLGSAWKNDGEEFTGSVPFTIRVIKDKEGDRWRVDLVQFEELPDTHKTPE